MGDFSVHFFEDSPVSRSAIGNLLYVCVLFTHSFEFLRNNTNTQKTKREATPGEDMEAFTKNLTIMKTEEECERFVNNGVWDVCQSLIDQEQCGGIEYKYSTDDYFRHPALWGGCGFLIGCILALIAFLIGSFICGKCCKKKSSTNIRNGTGSGSASVEGGKASKGTSSDTKNSSGDKKGKTFPNLNILMISLGPADKPVAKNQTVAMKPNRTMAKSVRDNEKKRKNKHGKTVGALTAMEVTMYK
ncbi:Protein CBG25342 [Caenorhabditis briggsae]|uniref:Protein CBG25342 n=1 Tax=Caenorhabditis briggsae TaxID=6238 RepID=B6IIK6_CAEBR|nr:Protein CBG25342 [Caenorhabditis briggsae]CAR99736.1 Protein CBG25342 [Caenorhabditis briggsae]